MEFGFKNCVGTLFKEIENETFNFILKTLHCSQFSLILLFCFCFDGQKSYTKQIAMDEKLAEEVKNMQQNENVVIRTSLLSYLLFTLIIVSSVMILSLLVPFSVSAAIGTCHNLLFRF